MILMQLELRTTDSRLELEIQHHFHSYLPGSLQIILYALQFSKTFHIALFNSCNSAVKQ